MTKKLKLVMATNNAAKLREARAIAGDRLEILSLDDIGYHDDIEETADSLEGNALIKVRAIKDATGLDCFADDTGLMVDALGGAPGVHTARYAGDACDPDANIDLLLRNLEGAADRSARFQTCVALSLDGEEHTFKGEVEGSIASGRSGSNGFGYDPVFIPAETGVCFAEMTDDAKNTISHRGRAISAMMRWLSALCLCIFCALAADAASSSADWRLYNTFDDKTDNVFDTPTRTYFLVQGQYQDTRFPDNADKLCFLFCLDKETGEIRPYNSQNFLSGSLIRQANYNAGKNYLLLVYDDQTIDFIHDDGEVHTMFDLKNFNTAFSKAIRSISFDPELDRVYLATDFGYFTINDRKYEVMLSGVYGTPIDRMVRLEDKMLIVRDGHLYCDDVDSRHISIDDFKPLLWRDNTSDAFNLISLSPSKCIVGRKVSGNENYYILSWDPTEQTPSAAASGSYPNSSVSENRDGVLFMQPSQLIQIDRETGLRTLIDRRPEDKAVPCGSWDLKDFYFSKSRTGFYSCRLGDDASWTVTSEASRPNSPAAFRCEDLMYSPGHGMLANTHGQSQNFVSHLATNPILLSGLKDGDWHMYGLPYLAPDSDLRLINPCGMAQDPENPDIFYFGSSVNGLLRYNIKDGSSLLHMTRSDDAPDLDGHVTLHERYSYWGGVSMFTNPKFDSRGHLFVAHTSTETAVYDAELWIWPKERRLASVSPETFQPFERIPLKGVLGSKGAQAIPLMSDGSRDILIYIVSNKYDGPIVVYDYNGTPETAADDRMVIMSDLKDDGESFSYHYLHCVLEDPQTGLVWIGSDNGVFTIDPKEAFSDPKKITRIKVSRNDGTSLADYLLAGTSVNNISIDGQGRKWFSLSGGGIVCTTADGKTILQEIDSENSMLPSDMVYATCYNPDSNSMMIATSAGLCEYYLTGQTVEEVSSNVRAYPNPVRHDYYGWVTIDGLEDNCIVKIADSAGNIVRELGPAVTGKVQWDVCGMDLNRVPSGVYFVLVSSGPGGGSYSEATKILVINR